MAARRVVREVVLAALLLGVSGRGRIAEPEGNLDVLLEDIVGGDPGERLCAEEDERGGRQRGGLAGRGGTAD
ncbi:hypothetical protein ACFWGL_42030 [Streptomyces sp. NPDC060286]|uniref:hypothetical protein n=1 Tax=unclassified Streptomyces TaxID=2593676 RepID=UPI0035DC01FC